MQPGLRFIGLLALGLVACGDDVTALQVELVAVGDPDPLDGVVRLRLVATGPSMNQVETEAPRAAGRLELPAIPLGPDRVITVEGKDGDGVVTARGQSDPFDLSADAPRTVKVPFASCSTTLYRDRDGDGYGDSTQSKTACQGSLAGYVAKPGDCDESDPEAYPGQTSYFDRTTKGSSGFDFDCDGQETKEYPDLEQCVKDPPDCIGEGWDGSVPECGQSGGFVACEKGGCGPLPAETRTQRCR